MKIAMVAPILAATPPRATGPQEQLCSLLTEALVARGHDVTLYATGDSRTKAKLEYIRERSFDAEFPGRAVDSGDVFYNHALMEHTFWALMQARQSGAEVVHTHRPMALLCQRGLGLPHVNTVHHGFGQGNQEARPFNARYFEFFAQFPGIEFVAISESQRQAYADAPRFRVIHHAVDFPAFPVGAATERSYLLYIGRIIPAKGVHFAIDVALQTGLPLRIAGPLDALHSDRVYFDRLIAPRLDGERIRYVGEATAESRLALYAGALAFINPIQWEEPFGLTMLESLACGTPVITYRRGAAVELIDEGVTGHLVDDLATMVTRTRELAGFDPARIRAHAEARFSVERMVTAYETAYRDAIARR